MNNRQFKFFVIILFTHTVILTKPKEIKKQIHFVIIYNYLFNIISFNIIYMINN